VYHGWATGEDPNSWSPPPGASHPDFDLPAEVAMLRAFALRLLARYPRYSVRLLMSEPAYLHVDVIDAGTTVASILMALNSKDGANWFYEYDLSGEGDVDLECRFGPDEIDAAVEELHRSVGAVRGRDDRPA
jgi:hypothetical protein